MKVRVVVLLSSIVSAAGLIALPAAAGEQVCNGQTATIAGSSASESLEGTPGDDVIVGGGGVDEITGGAGNDLICAGPRADEVSGGPDADRIYGSKGDDTLGGDGGPDFISGGDHDDDLTGGEGADVLHGKALDDVLAGGPGDDRLVGSNAPGIDVVDFSTAPEGIEADLQEGSATGEGDDTLVLIDGATGSYFNDLFFGSPNSDSLQGGPSDPLPNTHDGNDILVGRGGDDRLWATDGDDDMSGSFGDDLLYTPKNPSETTFGVVVFGGDNGDDHLIAAHHNAGVQIDLEAGTVESGEWFALESQVENVTGTDFDDELAGTDKPNRIKALGHAENGDLIEGRAGGDELQAEGAFAFEPSGEDVIHAGDGYDRVYAGIGPDTVFGGNGNDFINGNGALGGDEGNGPKTFHGEAGDDILWGSFFDDVLLGGSDVDVFFASEGEDTCDVEAGEQAQSCELSPPPKS